MASFNSASSCFTARLNGFVAIYSAVGIRDEFLNGALGKAMMAVGSGSVVTEDVSADALAIARGRQVEKPGWAARFRQMKAARKKK